MPQKKLKIHLGAALFVVVGFLTGAFTSLKTLHFISWSWVWVLSPLWIIAAILLLVFIVMACIAAIIEI